MCSPFRIVWFSLAISNYEHYFSSIVWRRIGQFRVAFCLSFKTSPDLHNNARAVKLITITKVVQNRKDTSRVEIIITTSIENCTKKKSKVFVALHAIFYTYCYYNFNPWGIFEHLTSFYIFHFYFRGTLRSNVWENYVGFQLTRSLHSKHS